MPLAGRSQISVHLIKSPKVQDSQSNYEQSQSLPIPKENRRREKMRKFPAIIWRARESWAQAQKYTVNSLMIRPKAHLARASQR